MKLKLIILSLFTLVLASCYDVEKPEKPEVFLDETKMTHVLVDLSIISSAKGIDKRKLEELKIMPRDYVFKKHGIDSTILAQNNYYYAYRPELYKKIYQTVTDSLNALKTEAQNKTLKKLDLKSNTKKVKIKSIQDSLKSQSKTFGAQNP